MMTQPNAPVSARPMTEDDLPSVCDIEARVHPSPWSQSQFAQELAKPYARLHVMTDDETDEVVHAYIVYWHLGQDCQILNVAVDLPYRGRGYAKQLIRQVVSHALKESATRVILDVRKSNLPAIQLYQRTGFVITAVRKGFYSNGEDAYTMILDLTQDGQPPHADF